MRTKSAIVKILPLATLVFVLASCAPAYASSPAVAATGWLVIQNSGSAGNVTIGGRSYHFETVNNGNPSDEQDFVNGINNDSSRTVNATLGAVGTCSTGVGGGSNKRDVCLTARTAGAAGNSINIGCSTRTGSWNCFTAGGLGVDSTLSGGVDAVLPSINYTPATSGLGQSAKDTSNFAIYLILGVMAAIMVAAGVYRGLTSVGKRFGILPNDVTGTLAGGRHGMRAHQNGHSHSAMRHKSAQWKRYYRRGARAGNWKGNTGVPF